MIINMENIKPKHVEFVSYTGEYPCLCSGTLTLRIDGEEVIFWNMGKAGIKGYPSFWITNGDCRNPHSSEWVIDYETIPEKYRDYFYEIDEVFNENVPRPCCGGCN